MRLGPASSSLPLFLHCGMGVPPYGGAQPSQPRAGAVFLSTPTLAYPKHPSPVPVQGGHPIPSTLTMKCHPVPRGHPIPSTLTMKGHPVPRGHPVPSTLTMKRHPGLMLVSEGGATYSQKGISENR
jgi:hypothetical protein